MKPNRLISFALSCAMLLPCLSALCGCGTNEIILRVYNWEEYIDEGGEGSYVYDMLLEDIDSSAEDISEDEIVAPSVIEDFEVWYEETYGTPIRVEYSNFGTNEDMYNQLKLGDSYDLICPSDYMIMKLAAEDMLEPFRADFFDKTDERNYYVNGVSDYIAQVFENNYVTVRTEDGQEHSAAWKDYAAGYMWGTTGLIYNPEYVDEEDLDGWAAMLDSAYRNKVTTKDNVRDTYFVGLAILFRDELLDLGDRFAAGELSSSEYNEQLTLIMNRTDEQTVAQVQEILLEMKSNIYGFETDSGKKDMVTGKIWLNFAWSGDAVYALDLAEEPEGDDEPVYLNYYIPEECANLWFDGWVMPKGANVEAAQAFVNFLSRPDIAVRNMYYIGYSSVIAADEVFEYVNDTYSVEEGDEEEGVAYDLSYFFGEDKSVLTYEDQLYRQLYTQYPPENVMVRCAVMDYFDEDTSERVNELWTKVKGETLELWTILVICVAIVVLAGGALYLRFGAKLDLRRRKPKKGYRRVDQSPVIHS